NHERARLHLHGAVGRAHGAAAGEAEIDFRRVRVTVIGTDLARLPAGDGDIAAADLAQDLFHVLLRIELLLGFQAEHVHVPDLPKAAHAFRVQVWPGR